MAGGEGTEDPEKVRVGGLDVDGSQQSGPLVPESEKATFMHVIKRQDSRRAVLSLVPTLTLGIIGGAVLPLAWAFSVTGIICGVVIMVVVAAANAYTCDLLLNQAHVTGTADYEDLSSIIAGKWWRFATEISIVVLLVGSLIGAFSQIGEVGSTGLLSFNSSLPNWLVGSDGRLIIAFCVVVIVAPLCLVNQLRQLEYAGIAGTAIVLWLMVTVVVNSIQHGLPSLGNKTFKTGGFTSLGNVTQAVSIFGFAFYIQPVMMPLLREVPVGLVGVKVVSYSTRITVLVNAFFIYFLTGFFGAAYYGVDTEDDILVNQWLGGGVPQGVLNVCMTAYLAVSCPVLEFPTRHTIEGWIPERYLKGKTARHLVITTLIIGFALIVALAYPNSSGNVLVVTGATGVCMVSYLIPIVNHLLLYFNRTKFQKEAAKTAPGSTHGGAGRPPTDLESNSKATGPVAPFTDRTRLRGGRLFFSYMKDVLLPIVVLVVGVFCSVSSLSTLGQ